jgi:hypothetical protein
MFVSRMKKKKKKQLMETLALVAFVLQAAEFGVQLWDKLRNTHERRTRSAKSR